MSSSLAFLLPATSGGLRVLIPRPTFSLRLSSTRPCRPSRLVSPRSARAAGTINMTTASPAAAAAGVDSVRPLYEAVCERVREISRLEGAMGLLDWDEQTMMPAGSASARGAQKAALAACVHDKQTEPALGAALDAVEAALAAADGGGDGASLNAYERAVLRDSRRSYDLTRRTSRELAGRMAALQAEAHAAWVAARKANDWAAFAPMLERLVATAKEAAVTSRPALADRPYDACLDTFERGMTAARVAEVFDALKPRVKALLDEVAAGTPPDVPAYLDGGPEWEVGRQAALSKAVATAMGFDFGKGRLDVAVHPFTGGPGPTDVRITTRYSTENPWEGVSGTVHEVSAGLGILVATVRAHRWEGVVCPFFVQVPLLTCLSPYLFSLSLRAVLVSFSASSLLQVGHALYEQGRNAAYEDLPVSQPLSMGVHESQSLLWEFCVGQSQAFHTFLTPLMHEHFPHTADVTPEMLHAARNRVAPGLIRVDADCLSYPGHIFVRFDIESGLMDGSLAVADVPRVWAEKMREYVGVEVTDDASGCLQDVHWSGLAFGYFPSYTIGAMMAVQLLGAARADLPDLDGMVERGEFQPLREWLREKVHSVGSLYASPDELLVAVTGRPLDVDGYVAFLRAKYAPVYGLGDQ